MTMTEINEKLEPAPWNRLESSTTIIHVHDTANKVTYKSSMADLAAALARIMMENGYLPYPGD